MGLIHSQRFIPGDLDTWSQRAALDGLHAKLPRLEYLERRAMENIEAFLATDHSGHCGVSWGKDSVVTAHLVHRVCPDYPVVWVRIWPLYNPDCELVRDAFLSRFSVPYHEIDVEWRGEQIREWAAHCAASGRITSLGYSPEQSAAVAGFREADRRFGARHISGVRGEESPVREIRMRRWGANSKNTSAPIGYWKHQDVFAYLAKYDLPIHPAYAMSLGGTLERDRIRVDALGGGKGGLRRADWEGRYYLDRVRLIGELAQERRP